MWEKVLIKYSGFSRDFNLTDLDLANPSDPADADLMSALVQELDADNLDEFEVDRTGDTVINVRPRATLAWR